MKVMLLGGSTQNVHADQSGDVAANAKDFMYEDKMTNDMPMQSQ